MSRQANNLRIADQMRVNTKIRNLMDLTPSRIRHKKLAEKYVHYKPDQTTLDKNFNKFLQDTHNKLKKDESEFLNNVKK